VLSDEIYSRMIYEGEHTSIAALPGMRERTIVLDGFSKIYAMTGWRLGYGLFPRELAPAIAKLMSNSNSCTAAFTQMAGVAALTGSQAPSEEMVAEFRRRRDVIVAGLNDIPGLTCRTPRGAFYVFPNITATGMSSREVADLLLYEGGVAALAGTSFGAYGEGYIRLSYANSIDNIQKALASIKRTLAEHAHPVAAAARANGRRPAGAKAGIKGVEASANSTNGKSNANGKASKTGKAGGAKRGGRTTAAVPTTGA
jgi:aspartate/methionine/tyrosine aminotransferase